MNTFECIFPIKKNDSFDSVMSRDVLRRISMHQKLYDFVELKTQQIKRMPLDLHSEFAKYKSSQYKGLYSNSTKNLRKKSIYIASLITILLIYPTFDKHSLAHTRRVRYYLDQQSILGQLVQNWWPHTCLVGSHYWPITIMAVQTGKGAADGILLSGYRYMNPMGRWVWFYIFRVYLAMEGGFLSNPIYL